MATYKRILAGTTLAAALLTVGLSCLAATQPLHGIPFTEVALSDTFWAPRIETNRVATIPHLLRELEKQGSLGGFRILAGDKSEAYRGYMWGDSDVYKTLEGMAAGLHLHPDPAMSQRMEQILGSVAGALSADGYLFPHLQLAEPGYRHFADETTRTCESYSIGHLIESAVEHHRLTGRTNYLAVARQAADLLRRTHASGELLQLSGHPEVELALIKLHEVTGEPAWLELAASLIENARHLTTLWSQGSPPLAGNEAQGHAVAMLYLYSAATDLARLKGDAALADLMRRKWTNIVGRKLYLTGGLGHSRHSEGFAADYDLPNDIAYCETCAAIANVFWQQRLFLASGDASYVDVLERSLYNNVLAGVAIQGDRFFYVNPLAADGQRKFNQGLTGRFAWTGCPCCPVNLVRFIPRVGDYFYAVRGNDVFVNLFATGQARIRAQSGELALRQDTPYPWDGRVRIEIMAAPERPIALHIRIPGWAKGRPLPTDLYHYADSSAEPVTLRLNGQPVAFSEESGYAILRRAWRQGDQIELNLPMPIRRVLAHEKVKEDAGRAAIERGPLVYCAEGVDHNGRAGNLVLPDGAKLTTTARPDLPGGLTVIEAAGQRMASGNFRRVEPANLKLIPYYAWNHRGSGSMAVWMPREASGARLPYDTSKWVGANYTPAYAANQVQMWHEFKPEIIERELAYGWAKEAEPCQPVIACWDDHPFTDIVNAHNDEDDFAGRWNQQADLNPRKGTVFTEAGARWYGKKPRSNGSPIEVIHWLSSRQAAGKTVPGVYLCWELMVGNSNCRWYWGTPDVAPEPAIPWCGLLWPDGSPVSYAEAEVIRSYTTGERRALLFEDFQSQADMSPQPPPGWTRFAETSPGTGSRHLALSGKAKVVAGETSWSDYLLEATVMLKESAGNAGLVFRVNEPGPGADQMRGYYAGFSTNTLYLGRMNNAWQPLATVDLIRRPNKVERDTWHLLRVAAEGDRIRVWFDPLHDDTRPLLDIRDDKSPLLKGAIGLRRDFGEGSFVLERKGVFSNSRSR